MIQGDETFHTKKLWISPLILNVTARWSRDTKHWHHHSYWFSTLFFLYCYFVWNSIMIGDRHMQMNNFLKFNIICNFFLMRLLSSSIQILYPWISKSKCRIFYQYYLPTPGMMINLLTHENLKPTFFFRFCFTRKPLYIGHK